jgi:hypothetical protein
VILDACRNTQLPGRSRSIDPRGGLSEMTPPAGSLIAFATDAGRTASDGDGVNGLYTQELLENLVRPGLTIEQVFKRTRAAVLKRSGGAQMPAEYSRLVGEDVYLAGEMPVADAEPVPVSPSGRTAAELAADASKSAGEGDARACVDVLHMLKDLGNSGEQIMQPLEILLERVKNDLKAEKVSAVPGDLAICETLVRAIPDLVPKNDTRAKGLLAKAQSRRGDCLLLLGRSREALGAFDIAASLAPDDAYILYNRGRAHRALGDLPAAKRDFQTAARPGSKQPGARKLAVEALAEMGAR